MYDVVREDVDAYSRVFMPVIIILEYERVEYIHTSYYILRA